MTIKFDPYKELERYDITRRPPLRRRRIEITLPNYVIDELKKRKQESGKPISRMIEESLK